VSGRERQDEGRRCPRDQLEPTPVGLRQAPVWTSSSGAGVRLVEAGVIAAICGYFAFGFAGVLGWF